MPVPFRRSITPDGLVVDVLVNRHNVMPFSASLTLSSWRQTNRLRETAAMPNGPLPGVLMHVRGLVAALHDRAATDRELLERFVSRREEAAFAALLERHGAMVLGVCRRVLRDAHDAEDACQATFLAL